MTELQRPSRGSCAYAYGNDSYVSLPAVLLTLLSLSATAGRRGCLARTCTLVLLPAFWVIATITAAAVLVAITLFGGAHGMARKRDGEIPGSGGQPDLPPCATAGGDGIGPESPPWVAPATGGPGRGYLGARDDEAYRKCPTLHDFLTLGGWGGKQRKTGTVLFFAEDGKWKACVNDRDGGNYCFTASDSLLGLLEALERGLKAGTLDWRASKTRR